MFRRKSEEHHEELQAYSRDWRKSTITFTLTLSQLLDILKITIDEVKSGSEKKNEVLKILREAREAIHVETKEAES